MIPYAQLRKESRIDLADSVPLSAPLTIYVEPTNRCNLSCDFCPQSLGDYVERAGYSQDMDIELYRKVIAEIEAMGIKSLKLYFFGEPLLHKSIGEICRLGTTVCERVELTTNALPMAERKAQELIDSGLHYLRISIYDERPEKVIENAKRLRNMRDTQGKKLPYICVKVHNPEDVDRVRQDYEGIADEVTCEELHSIGSDMIQIKPMTGTQKACAYPFYNLVVKSNGDVVPCCVAWEKSLVVGNVRDNTLDEIWRSEALANIHRLHLAGRRGELAACAKCDTIFNSPDSVDSLTVEEFERRRG